MACCKCCCGNKDCAQGEQGKCCCGTTEKNCCTAEQYCCDGACQSTPCTGACCDPTFGCTQTADEATCTEDGGTWLGLGVPCDPNPCPGACCDDTFACSQSTQADCVAEGGTFLGSGTPCIPNPCECNVDADCLSSRFCVETYQSLEQEYDCDDGFTQSGSPGDWTCTRIQEFASCDDCPDDPDAPGRIEYVSRCDEPICCDGQCVAGPCDP